MENSYDFSKYEPSILIYRKKIGGKKFFVAYIVSESKIIILNNKDGIEELINIINTPLKIRFVGLSRADIRRILDLIANDDYKITMKKIKNKKNLLLIFDVVFLKQKHLDSKCKKNN